ncbi:glycosyltransferase family 2 protein [Desulfonatronum thioautotrophicum]|uniref:glycosyltransferase family 2 protein n=1 Tax=Desulfonatronum thioautotrophicum TaxID=617001 RepID=UPI000A0779C4|nr:glycosyltransferase [Desulfonatronum thioautotrophicum]
MTTPLVSVIMAAYNHAAFVEQAVASVLEQRGVDLELLVADDGSADATRRTVAAIRDPRLRFFPHEVNRGACVVTNELITRSRGEFIALINSDDYWIDRDKLARQTDLLRTQPRYGASFGRPRFVDGNGGPLAKAGLGQGRVFDQENRSRGAWLRQFFDHGNCICHPTMLIRRECYAAAGMYDNRLRQLPDFDMWIRLVKHVDIHVSDAEMIAFRILPGENASCGTNENMRRLLHEFHFILRGFFTGCPRSVFLDGFADLLVDKVPEGRAGEEIEQTLIYFSRDRWAHYIYNLVGLEKMHALLGSAPHRELLARRYAMDDRTFHQLSVEVGAFDMDDVAARLCTVPAKVMASEIWQRALLRIPGPFRKLFRRFSPAP